MAGTVVLLVMMAAFMFGAIVGELADQRAYEREVRDMAWADAFLADLRAAFEYGDALDRIQVAVAS